MGRGLGGFTSPPCKAGGCFAHALNFLAYVTSERERGAFRKLAPSLCRVPLVCHQSFITMMKFPKHNAWFRSLLNSCISQFLKMDVCDNCSLQPGALHMVRAQRLVWQSALSAQGRMQYRSKICNSYSDYNPLRMTCKLVHEKTNQSWRREQGRHVDINPLSFASKAREAFVLLQNHQTDICKPSLHWLALT